MPWQWTPAEMNLCDSSAPRPMRLKPYSCWKTIPRAMQCHVAGKGIVGREEKEREYSYKDEHHDETLLSHHHFSPCCSCCTATLYHSNLPFKTPERFFKIILFCCYTCSLYFKWLVHCCCTILLFNNSFNLFKIMCLLNLMMNIYWICITHLKRGLHAAPWMQHILWFVPVWIL